MKVKLINVAEYDLKEGKADEIPFNTFSNFSNLCGNNEKIGEKKLPTVRLFKSIDEFKNLTEDERRMLDVSENVRILPNGQFLVFLRDENNKKIATTTETDATADTKEN